MKNFEKVKCIVIDWDGTLISTELLIHEAYTETMLQLQIKHGYSERLSWMREETHNQNGRSPADIFADKSIWGDFGAQAKKIFYDELSWLRDSFCDYIKLNAGTIELLQLLQSLPNNPRIVLLANKSQDILLTEVSKYNLLEYFDLIIGSQHNAAIDKPSLAAFEKAVEDLEISNPHEEVIHIGDNPNVDPRFAAAYGATSVLINNCHGATAPDILTLVQIWKE